MILHICYHTKFGRSGSNRMSVGRGYSKIVEASAHPLCNRGVADPLESRSYLTSYQIWSLYRSNRLGVGRGRWAPPLGKGCGLPLETHFYPTPVTLSNLVAVGQTVWAMTPYKHDFHHLSYHADFGHSTSNRTGVIMETLKI